MRLGELTERRESEKQPEDDENECYGCDGTIKRKFLEEIKY